MKAASDIRDILFRYRGYIPIPLVALMIIFGQPTALSFALGLPVALAGEALRLWGVSIVGSATRVTTGGVSAFELVTSGPYAHVRNPLYLGNMLMYLGMGVASNALAPWLQISALAWFVVQYSAIVSREEEFLVERFGSEYERYRAAVPRFIPSLRQYRGGAPQPGLSWLRGLRSERRTLQAVFWVTAALVVREMF